MKPLTFSMRTLGDEVAVVGAGHEIGGSRREPLAAYDVAVFERRTPNRIGSPRPAAADQELERKGSPGLLGVRVAGQTACVYSDEPGLAPMIAGR